MSSILGVLADSEASRRQAPCSFDVAGSDPPIWCVSVVDVAAGRRASLIEVIKGRTAAEVSGCFGARPDEWRTESSRAAFPADAAKLSVQGCLLLSAAAS
jgi:hypothetical protein